MSVKVRALLKALISPKQMNSYVILYMTARNVNKRVCVILMRKILHFLTFLIKLYGLNSIHF